MRVIGTINRFRPLKAIFGAFLGILGFIGIAKAVCDPTLVPTYTGRSGIGVIPINACGWGNVLNNNFQIVDSSMCVQNKNNTFTATNLFASGSHNSIGYQTPIYFQTSNNSDGAYITSEVGLGAQSLTIVAPSGIGIGADNSFGGIPNVTIGLAGKPGSFAVVGSSVDLTNSYSGFVGTTNVTQSVLWSLPKADGSNGQILSTDGQAHLSFVNQSGGGGGGASSLAVNKNSVQITSPTAALNMLAPPFLVTSIGGGTTSQFTLDPSSVTLLGPNVIQLTSALQSGSTFYVSSGTVSGSLIVNQSKTTTVNGVTIVSTGTGNAIAVTENGQAGGALQVDNGGALNVTQTTLGDAVVIVSSYSDSQLGSSDLLILDRNVNRNDPIIRVFKNANNSAPEMRWDSPAPNMEMVATSTDNTHGRGKWEPFANPSGSEIIQTPNNRCWDNSSFENLAYWEPLNIQSAIGKPGLYLRNSDSTGCDSAVVASSNTSGINFFTINSHTVGLTGPLQVGSGSWRVRLSSTIPVQGEVYYSNGADSTGDYPIATTLGGSTGQCLQFNSGGVPTWGSCGTGGGGGSSTLAISSGSGTNSVIVSSPTSNIVVDSNTIILSLQGSTSGFLQLNGSSVTLQGPNVINLTSTLQSGATFYVSSGTVGSLIVATMTPTVMLDNNGINTLFLYNNFNAFIGPGAGNQGLLNSARNTALGPGPMLSTISGNNNTAIGYAALDGAGPINNNVAVGESSLFSTQLGNSNTGVGASAAKNIVTGSSNTAIGAFVFFGPDLSTSATVGSGNTFIGYEAGVSTSATINNSVAIGIGATVSSSNTMQLGGAGNNAVRVIISTFTASSGTVKNQLVLPYSGTGGILYTDSGGNVISTPLNVWDTGTGNVIIGGGAGDPNGWLTVNMGSSLHGINFVGTGNSWGVPIFISTTNFVSENLFNLTNSSGNVSSSLSNNGAFTIGNTAAQILTSTFMPVIIYASNSAGNTSQTQVTLSSDSVGASATSNNKFEFGTGLGANGNQFMGPYDFSVDTNAVTTAKNMKITTLTGNQCVQTDSTGKLISSGGNCGGSGTPAGTSFQLDFTSGSIFGADSSLSFSTVTKVLSAASINTGTGTIVGEIQLYELAANGSNFVSWLSSETLSQNLRLKFPDDTPSANQVMRLTAPSNSISNISFDDAGGIGACAQNTFETGDNEAAAPTCSQVTFSQLGGIALSNQIPSDVAYTDIKNTFSTYQVFNSSVSISSNTYVAGSTFTFKNNGLLSVSQINWANGTVQISSPGVSGGTPAGNNFDVQIDSNGAFGAYDNFQNNGTTVTISSAALFSSTVTVQNASSVGINGFTTMLFSTISVVLDSSSPFTTGSSMTVNNAFSVIAPTTTVYSAQFSSSTSIFHLAISTTGHIISNGPSPTISSCGSAPNGSVVGDDNEGTITVGGGAVTACTLTFANTWGISPTCVITDNSTTSTGDISSISATAFTSSFSVSVGGGTIWYHCRCVGSSCR